MPAAFVLMPFDEKFDSVYDDFICPILRDAGMTVDRADNIESQRNILRDVMCGIGGSELIIADITGSNPNVYYELGVAHAARKPVILLTQSLDDVPFDLRSYRLIEYDTHFTKISAAKDRLASYIKSFLEGKLLTGNPVMDFLPGHDAAMSTDDPSVPESHDGAHDGGNPDDTSTLGLLDHVLQITDGYTQIADLVTGVSERTQALGNDMNDANEELVALDMNKSDSSPRAAHSIARRLADKMRTFNESVDAFNSDFPLVLGATEDSLEYIVAFQREHIPTDINIAEQAQPLNGLLFGLRGAREGLSAMMESLDDMPNIERRLNREVVRAKTGLIVMQSHLDRFMASILRALNNLKSDEAED